MIKGSVMDKLIELAPYPDACLVIHRNTNCRNGGLIKKNHLERFSYYICTCTFFAPIIYLALVTVGGGGGLQVEKFRKCSCIGTIL